MARLTASGLYATPGGAKRSIEVTGLKKALHFIDSPAQLGLPLDLPLLVAGKLNESRKVMIAREFPEDRLCARYGFEIFFLVDQALEGTTLAFQALESRFLLLLVEDKIPQLDHRSIFGMRCQQRV